MKISPSFISVLILNMVCLGTIAFASDSFQIPVKGKITLVDITSEGCDTCEEVLPVIKKIKERYSGKIEVVMVDFWKNPGIVKKVETNTSPTILIFDKAGNEVFRNYGYVSEKELGLQLQVMDIE